MIKAQYFNILARHPFSSWCNTVNLDTCSDGVNLPTCHQWKQYVRQNIWNIANRNLTISSLCLFNYCVPFANTTVVWYYVYFDPDCDWPWFLPDCVFRNCLHDDLLFVTLYSPFYKAPFYDFPGYHSLNNNLKYFLFWCFFNVCFVVYVIIDSQLKVVPIKWRAFYK